MSTATPMAATGSVFASPGARAEHEWRMQWLRRLLGRLRPRTRRLTRVELESLHRNRMLARSVRDRHAAEALRFGVAPMR